MLTWISQNAATIITLAVLAIGIGFAIRAVVKHKNSCSCGCSGNCASCGKSCAGK